MQCTPQGWCWCTEENGEAVGGVVQGRPECDETQHSDTVTVVVMVLGMLVAAVCITGYCILTKSRAQAVYMNAALTQNGDDLESLNAEIVSSKNDSLCLRADTLRPPPTPPIPKLVGEVPVEGGDGNALVGVGAGVQVHSFSSLPEENPLHHSKGEEGR